MARKQGQTNVSFDFEIRATSPLDARTYVDTVDDLTKASAFTSGDGNIYTYEKMIVVVKSGTNAGVYQLQNFALGLSPASYIWKRIEVSDENTVDLYNKGLVAGTNTVPLSDTLANAIYNGIRKDVVVDSFTSNDPSAALSAKKGKELDERLTAISKALIYKGTVNTYEDLWNLLSTDTILPGYMYNVKNDVTYKEYKSYPDVNDISHTGYDSTTDEGYKEDDIIFTAGTNFAWRELDATKPVSITNGTWDALGGAADDGIYEQIIKTNQEVTNINNTLNDGDIAPAWHIVS